MGEKNQMNKYVRFNIEYVKGCLSDLGLSQYKLAKMLGVERRQLYCWMKGKHRPRYDTLHKISEILECKIEDLLYVEEGKYEKNS